MQGALESALIAVRAMLRAPGDWNTVSIARSISGFWYVVSKLSRASLTRHDEQ
jgi:hypothetical protein